MGQPFSLDVARLASDPDTPSLPLTYSLGPGAPAGVSINSTTGLLSWNVPATQRIGTYPVTVIVADDSSPANTASETIDLAVVNPGPPLTVAAPAVSTNKGFSITFSFSSPVDPVIAANPANYILTEAANDPRGKKRASSPKGHQTDRRLRRGDRPGHAQGGEEAPGGEALHAHDRRLRRRRDRQA